MYSTLLTQPHFDEPPLGYTLLKPIGAWICSPLFHSALHIHPLLVLLNVIPHRYTLLS
jgi:hypothetical protein